MTAWIAFDRSDHAETTLAIELRCLKIMAFEHYELAASRFRLLFNPLHQPRTDTFSAHRFRHKQMPDVAGATPRPAIGAADHDTILVAKKEAVELPITDACRLHIEFVETIFERADRPGTRVSVEDEIKPRCSLSQPFNGHAVSAKTSKIQTVAVRC
jgi:hypothetical protein